MAWEQPIYQTQHAAYLLLTLSIVMREHVWWDRHNCSAHVICRWTESAANKARCYFFPLVVPYFATILFRILLQQITDETTLLVQVFLLRLLPDQQVALRPSAETNLYHPHRIEHLLINWLLDYVHALEHSSISSVLGNTLASNTTGVLL